MLPDPIRAYRYAGSVLRSFVVFGPWLGALVPVALFGLQLTVVVHAVLTSLKGTVPMSSVVLLFVTVAMYSFGADGVLGPNLRDGKPQLVLRLRLVELYAHSLLMTRDVQATLDQSREAARAIYLDARGVVDARENFGLMQTAVRLSLVMSDATPTAEFTPAHEQLLATFPAEATTSKHLPL